jgi:hypothetical protein
MYNFARDTFSKAQNYYKAIHNSVMLIVMVCGKITEKQRDGSSAFLRSNG